ncbi:MAG: phospho-sugar mutase [Flavobacteriales bacterium]|nr:phospho-sugar mutase [Flavobacteriales bacterium]
MVDREEIITRAKSWLDPSFDDETRKIVHDLIENNLAELEESFYKDLEFGTGGLRGIMGVGTNRMNIYTVAMSTQGLANYLKKCFPDEKIKVAIAFDSRNKSALFAKRAADILSANGIMVCLFDQLRPTPELSFAVRKLNCHSGIVITASHNPKEFNGYKVYWQDGGQLVPPHDKNIIAEVRKIQSMKDVKQVVIKDNLKAISKEMDSAYREAVIEQCVNKELIQNSDLKIVYTSIHGTGITMVPDVLREAGFSDVHVLEEQAEPNGDFPTVESPNPEESSAMSLGLAKAMEINADILLGTDPDADRVGLAVLNDEGKMELLNGNQAATLIIYYILEGLKQANSLKGNEFVAKTIVTTQLIDEICMSYGVNCYNTLTGFKYIAEQIRLREGKERFVAGGEESYGYLIGDYTRDKDAIVSSLLLCEIAAWAKKGNKTLNDILADIYVQYGFYKESLVSLTKKGRRGAEEISQMMEGLKKEPRKELLGKKLLKTWDLNEGIEKSMISGNIAVLDLPKSNVFQMFYEDGYVVTARPSGTEPKIKFYLGVREKLQKPSELNAVNERLTMVLHNIKKEFGIA